MCVYISLKYRTSWTCSAQELETHHISIVPFLMHFATEAADSIIYKPVFKATFHSGFRLLGILLHLATIETRVMYLKGSDFFFLHLISTC